MSSKIEIGIIEFAVINRTILKEYDEKIKGFQILNAEGIFTLKDEKELLKLQLRGLTFENQGLNTDDKHKAKIWKIQKLRFGDTDYLSYSLYIYSGIDGTNRPAYYGSSIIHKMAEGYVDIYMVYKYLKIFANNSYNRSILFNPKEYQNEYENTNWELEIKDIEEHQYSLSKNDKNYFTNNSKDIPTCFSILLQSNNINNVHIIDSDKLLLSDKLKGKVTPLIKVDSNENIENTQTKEELKLINIDEEVLKNEEGQKTLEELEALKAEQERLKLEEEEQERQFKAEQERIKKEAELKAAELAAIEAEQERLRLEEEEQSKAKQEQRAAVIKLVSIVVGILVIVLLTYVIYSAFSSIPSEKDQNISPETTTKIDKKEELNTQIVDTSNPNIENNTKIKLVDDELDNSRDLFSKKMEIEEYMNEVEKYLKNEKLTRRQIDIYKDSLSNSSVDFMVEDEYEEFYKKITDLIKKLDKTKIPIYLSKCRCYKNENGTIRFAFDFPISRKSLRKNITLENMRTENGGGTLTIKFNPKIKLETNVISITGNCNGITITGKGSIVTVRDISKTMINDEKKLINGYTEKTPTIYVDLTNQPSQ